MKLKSKLISSGLITAVTCALVGSITGTFAWYGYSTRATAELTGTSIDKAANLQIGIVEANASGEVATSLSNLQKEGNIYWSPVGGGLNQDIIANYLDAKGHKRNEMRPTTSGRLTSDGELENPDYNPNEPISQANYPFLPKFNDVEPKEMSFYQHNLIDNDYDKADPSDYVVLPLAIRVQDLKGDYLRNNKIYVHKLDFSVLNGANNSNIANATRIDFKTWNNDDNIKHEIVSPQANDGTIKLGGLLDMNKDGYVDVKQTDFGYQERDELVYGAVKGEGYQEYKNIKNDNYNPEDAEHNGKYIVLTDNSEVDVSAEDPNGTYYSQFKYEVNPNYNANEPTSRKYILAKSLQDANTIEYDQEKVVNPYLEENADYGDGSNFVYFDADHKVAAKMGLLKDYIAVKDGDKNVLEAIPAGNDRNDLPFDYSKLYSKNSQNEYYQDGDNPFCGTANSEANCYFEKAEGDYGVCLKENDPAQLNKNFVLADGSLVAKDTTVGNDDDEYGFIYVHVVNPDYVASRPYDSTHTDRAHQYIEKEQDAYYKVTDEVPLPPTYERKVHLSLEEQRYHQANTRTVKAFEAFEQEFLGLDKFETNFDNKGWLNDADAHEVCNTGDDGLVYCTLTMWIEGWDENCDKTMLGVEYGLGIEFQIDRVDVKA